MPENTDIPGDRLYRGTIHEYVPLSSNHKILVIIDSKMTDKTVISVDRSRIDTLLKDFPVGSEVVFYWSDAEREYIFRKPEAT
jgi:hypothetical protein